MPKYITYRRISLPEKDSGSVSLQWQAEVCKAWLARKGETAWHDVVDDGVTAGVPLHQRPGGKALADLREGHEAVIVCAKLDRVWRSVEDMCSTLRAWEREGVQFVCVTEGFDPTTAFGRFQMTLMTAFAELERHTIGERVKAAISSRKAAGQRYSPEPPYGWRHEGTVDIGGGRTTGGVLAKDDAEQSVIELVKGWRRRGLSLREIASKLTENNIPTRRGGAWIHTMVQKILVSERERREEKKKGNFKAGKLTRTEPATNNHEQER